MNAALQFRAAYAAALGDYLRDPGESSLSVAYELARDAVGRDLSVLDLAVAHQEALLSALARVSSGSEVDRITRGAGDFFLEGLSTFEMFSADSGRPSLRPRSSDVTRSCRG